MLHLTTLGSTCIKDDGGIELSLDAQRPKRLALLAYLAAARPFGPHRRDMLVSVFWPELDEARARAALRQSLHGVRRAIGADAILSYGLESVELSRSSLACDVWEFEAAVAAGRHGVVLDLYRGDFLVGLHVSDAPAFEQWVESERTRLRAMAANSAWTLADDALRSASGDVLRSVRVALGLSGLDERALRRGMRLLAHAGERASAIATYERFVTELRRELEVDVDPETRALATQLRRTATPAIAKEPDGAILTDTHRSLESVRKGSAPVRPAPMDSRRRVAIAVASGLIALVAAARYSSAPHAQADPRRVEVSAFANETSVPALESVARQATLDARASLAQLPGVAVTAGAGSGGTLVRAVLRSEGDSTVLRGEVIDVQSGIVVRTVHGAAGALASFNDRLSTAVATALYPGWGTVLSEPPSYNAYRDFLTGMREIKREHHADAIASFRRAFAEDSSFTAAGLLAGIELYQVRRFLAADSLVQAITRRGNTLRPLDERLLEWLTLSLRGDRIGARAVMQTVVALAPRADLAWLQLAIDNVETARPSEALSALEHIDVNADFGEGWASYWATRIEALHLMGEHGRELAVARDGLSRHPELRVLAVYELRALAALGRVDELNARIQTLPTKTDSAAATESIVRQVAQELNAHGRSEAAERLLKRLANSYSRLENGSQPGSDPLSVARTYYLAGDYAKAFPVYDSVFRSHPRCVDCIGTLGVVAARRGDRSTAELHARALSAKDVTTRRYQFGRDLLWRARIANMLGDRSSAASLLTEAFANGLEYDVMMHTDPDLARLDIDSIYRAFALVR